MSVESKKRIASMAWWNNITNRDELKAKYNMLLPTGLQIQKIWESEHKVIPKAKDVHQKILDLIRDEVSMGTYGIVELTLREASALAQLEATIDEQC